VVPIRLQLTEEELATFAVHRPDLPGVEVRPRLTRFYPGNGSAVHALGYVAAISEQDQSRIDTTNYAGTTLIGKLGIERAYEDELHGDTGHQQLLVNAQGRLVERVGLSAADLQRQEPMAGNDLILALDMRVQRAAEQALAGRRAAVVAIDPNNGDVVAFVSMPTVRPERLRAWALRERVRDTAERHRQAAVRSALRGEYPPGSTIKPLVALAALEYGTTDPKTTRICRGVFQLPGSSHRYRDWKKGGHGTVSMHKAIAESCDTYFYDVANHLGIDRMHDFLSAFGLGGETGIDIAGERSGLVPSKAWKKGAFKRRDLQTWFPGETVIAGIGQGYMLATPLQLAQMAATIATRGKRYSPRLVKRIRNVSTGETRELPPEPLSSIEVKDPAHWDVIIGGMIGVTNDPTGTARRSQAGAPYKIAGKTGTAQVFSVGQHEQYKESEVEERLRDHALFVAFAPAEAPKLAVAVLVENGRSGSGTAAPIARAVFDAYLLPPEEARKEEAATVPAPAAGGEE
jgi:penicillin-binding protein 2